MFKILRIGTIIFLFIFLPFLSIGQVQNSKHINLYVFKSPLMFSEQTLKYFEKEKIFNAKLLTTSAIDPKHEGKIDTFDITRYMKFFYPDSIATGICVIDWEDTIFYDLRQGKDNPLFKLAEQKFISVLSIMKKSRSNVKVGIYGLPFGVFYPSQRRYNEARKLDNLFKYCDFISPSLYLSFSDQEIGHQKNVAFLHDNLQIALDYGSRLHKPVIPFTWELIHPSNKKYGGTIIPKDEYLDFINLIVNYKYNNISTKGLFLWNPSNPSPVYYKKNLGLTDIDKANAISNRDSLIIDYYNGILKILKRKN